MDENQQTVGAMNVVVGQSVLGPVEPSSRWLRHLASVPLRVVDMADYDNWARDTSLSVRAMCIHGQTKSNGSKLTRICGSRTPREGLTAPSRTRDVPAVDAGDRGTDCRDIRPVVVRFKHTTNADECDTNKTKYNNRLFLGRPYKGLRNLHPSLFTQTGGNYPRCVRPDTDRLSCRSTGRQEGVSATQSDADVHRTARVRYVDVIRPAAKSATPTATAAQMPYYVNILPTKVMYSSLTPPCTKSGVQVVEWHRPKTIGPTKSTTPSCCHVVKGSTCVNAFVKDTRVEHSYPDEERVFREAVVANSLTTSKKLPHWAGQ